ncbi:MAG: 23S rRNA (pseudouridine(1915)-N(3))-methyltransferase RlmH [Bacteroidia bacterium]|nr:23S rRNA (pseudouridine(1915)-N(3))-methyltransferase RlmH [Bacteroidia bacterium]
MKCELFVVGKTTEKYLQEGINEYLKRLTHYLPSVTVIISPSSKTDAPKAIGEEGESMLKRIQPRDFVIVLDENGTLLSSKDLATKLEKWLTEGYSKIIFVTGGAYGIAESVKKRANFILSASKFTFTHQMIRLILTEQIYRAMTIVKNESYHHG